MQSFTEISDKISAAIDRLSLPAQPAGLYEPVQYIMSLGGKRVRPALVLMGYNLFSDDIEKAIPAALAVEIFHNFTLLHDDIMDNAAIRRGKPTVHKVWNQNTAILSGDAMQILAYEYLAQTDGKVLPDILKCFNCMALEICEGQQLDMDFENRADVTSDEYIEMIRLKTAVLLGTALQIGALLGGADAVDAENLYSFGTSVGLAFQLQDDLLDVYGDEKTFGKKIGGDILCNKKTYLLIAALQSSDKASVDKLQQWLSAEPSEEKIKAVTEIYNKTNVKNLCEGKIREFHKLAFAALNRVNIENEKKAVLQKFSADLLNRTK